MKLTNKAKLAVVGCGAVAQNFYIPALKSLKISPLYFIDKNIDSAKKCAKNFPSSLAVESFDDIIDSFDEAIITLPNSLHFPVALDLIKNKKNLLIEKPICISSTESKAIKQLSESNGLSVVCGNMRRQLRSVSYIKKLISDKTLGTIVSFKCREGGVFNWPIQSENFWDKKFSGGGVLLDTGSHTVEQILFWFGYPTNINYFDNTIDNIESDCLIDLDFQNFKGSLQLSRTLGLDCKMYIKFTEGDIIFDLVGNKIDINCPSKVKDLIQLDKFNQKNQSYDDLISKQIHEWYKLINGMPANVVTTSDAHKVMEFIDHCYNNRMELEF